MVYWFENIHFATLLCIDSDPSVNISDIRHQKSPVLAVKGPGRWSTQNTKQTDIATDRLNRPRGRTSENPSEHSESYT